MALPVMELTVSRTIAAPAERVFEAWMDPKHPGAPWTGCERVLLHPEVDGLYYWAVQHEGRIWAHYGRFVEIARPRRVAYTWMSEATKGLESVVTVTFEPRGEQTEVTLRHSGLPDEAMGRQHEAGWTGILGRLGETLAGKRA